MMVELGGYRERRFDGKRDFELFEDRLEVVGGASLGSKFELNVPLATLSSEIDRYWSRPPGFWSGVLMALIFFVGPQCFGDSIAPSLLGLLTVFAIGGVLLAVVTRNRVEWAAFKNHAGATGIDIAKIGPDAPEFENFVRSISQAIRSCNERSHAKNGTKPGVQPDP